MDVFTSSFSWIGNILTNIAKWVVNLLPNSPFALLDFGPVKEYLGYINYFVPVDFILTVTETWLSAIVVFYAYQAYLRWIKALG